MRPSSDWKSEERFTHAEMATFRAIENGVALARPTSDGVSMAVDNRGRVLASADSYAAEQTVMVINVPTHGTPTLYARIGDSFAYLCAAGLVVLVALALVRRSAVGAPAPHGHPPLARLAEINRAGFGPSRQLGQQC